jgi:uncharacterized protein YoxC
MKGFDGFFENASIETKKFLCRVNDIFGKQKELEQQSRKLATQATRYVAQTQQWLALVDNFNNSLKVFICKKDTALINKKNNRN